MNKLLHIALFGIVVALLAVLSGFQYQGAYAAPNNQNNPLSAVPVYNVVSGVTATNNVSGVAAVISTHSGTAIQVNVLSASGVGAVYDSATTGSAVAATQIFSIPATVGAYTLNWPVKN